MNLEQHSKDTSVNGITESKPRSQIPPGALAILPLRNAVLLREQLKAIRKALGEEDSKNVEIEELRKKKWIAW